MAVISARTFNQSPSKAKAMAKFGPVFVTDRGRPAIVVLNIAEYERLAGRGSIRDSLRMADEIESEPVISPDLGHVAEL